VAGQFRRRPSAREEFTREWSANSVNGVNETLVRMRRGCDLASTPEGAVADLDDKVGVKHRFAIVEQRSVLDFLIDLCGAPPTADVSTSRWQPNRPRKPRLAQDLPDANAIGPGT
jgi:hypothetical protein